MIVRAHQGAATDRDSLLADVKVEKSADFFRLIRAQAALFETADAHHLPVKLDALLGAELDVDRGVAAGRRGGVFFIGGGRRFRAHGKVFRGKKCGEKMQLLSGGG
jgi:hypothetical protein